MTTTINISALTPCDQVTGMRIVSQMFALKDAGKGTILRITGRPLWGEDQPQPQVTGTIVAKIGDETLMVTLSHGEYTKFELSSSTKIAEAIPGIRDLIRLHEEEGQRLLEWLRSFGTEEISEDLARCIFEKVHEEGQYPIDDAAIGKLLKTINGRKVTAAPRRWSVSIGDKTRLVVAKHYLGPLRTNGWDFVPMEEGVTPKPIHCPDGQEVVDAITGAPLRNVNGALYHDACVGDNCVVSPLYAGTNLLVGVRW